MVQHLPSNVCRMELKQPRVVPLIRSAQPQLHPTVDMHEIDWVLFFNKSMLSVDMLRREVRVLPVCTLNRIQLSHYRRFT